MTNCLQLGNDIRRLRGPGRPKKPTAPREQVSRLERTVALLGLTRADLAALSGYDPSTITNWLLGRFNFPAEAADKIESALIDFIEQTQTTLAAALSELED